LLVATSAIGGCHARQAHPRRRDRRGSNPAARSLPASPEVLTTEFRAADGSSDRIRYPALGWSWSSIRC